MNEINQHDGNAAAVIEVAREAADRAKTLQEVDAKTNYVTVGRDGTAKILDLEALRERPDRAAGTYKPQTVDSFIDYVKTHKVDKHTTIWVHPTEGKVVAILDDHAAGENGPAWRKHRVELDLVKTPEWVLWEGNDGILMDQEAFAEHLQDGLPQIAEPDGATLLEIAQTFQVHTGVQFHKGVDITSGEVRFRYDEEQQAKAGKAGEIEVPREFRLVLVPFVGEVAVNLTASLRWRTSRGQFAIGYKLANPEKVIEQVLEGIRERLAGEFERVYVGQPA